MAGNSVPSASAFLHAGAKQNLEIRLSESSRVGRDPGNDVVFEDESVSRIHALIYTAESGGYYIFDLGSHNGTFVNGSRISAPTLLKDGAKILFGAAEAQFRHQQAPAPADVAVNGVTTSKFLPRRLVTVLV